MADSGPSSRSNNALWEDDDIHLIKPLSRTVAVV